MSSPLHQSLPRDPPSLSARADVGSGESMAPGYLVGLLSSSLDTPGDTSAPLSSAGSHPPRPSLERHRPRSLFLERGHTLSTFTLGNGREGMEEAGAWRATAVGETPLDRTIDAIGMGPYQWALLVLSGCGWAADNMWLQGIAIILPRVQDQFAVSDSWIGALSSSMFAGMMVGAIAWGSYSDSYGRKDAFNGTLLVTAIFGWLSAFATSFPALCFLLFCLGTGVGGSMPTDGTLFLENLPKRKQYLLTALSVFFAAGSVATSVLGLIIIPNNSCPEHGACDVLTQNKGWRYLLGSLGSLTMAFVIARLIFFRLYESPKFLVASGRPDEARVVLQQIAAYNGAPLPVSLSDVHDEVQTPSPTRPSGYASPAPTTFNSLSRLSGSLSSKAYQSVPTEDTPEDRIAETERASEDQTRSPGRERDADADGFSDHESLTRKPIESTFSRWLDMLPSSWRGGATELVDRYTQLFEPPWRQTTTLVWAIWTLVSLAYTMFNVFLLKFLETRLSAGGEGDAGGGGGRLEVMQDYTLYALSSLPGSLLGAWLIETPLGRVKSMALSTAFTGAAIFLFTAVNSRVGLVLCSMTISVAATTMYACIYGYTPEVFSTDIRGTACGSASALSRLAGILAPLIAGYLLSLFDVLPLYLSVVLFAATVGCMLALPIETRGRTGEGGAVISH